MGILEMRPVPVCMISPFLSSTTVEPVKINWPFWFRSSTVFRTASHKTGATCYSSISRGVSPLSSKDGLVRAVARYPSRLSGSCILITLFDCCMAVVVFPHHFGPTICTAPKASKRSRSILSAILSKYFIFNMFLFAKIVINSGIYK